MTRPAGDVTLFGSLLISVTPWARSEGAFPLFCDRKTSAWRAWSILIPLCSLCRRNLLTSVSAGTTATLRRLRNDALNEKQKGGICCLSLRTRATYTGTSRSVYCHQCSGSLLREKGDETSEGLERSMTSILS